MQQSLALLTLHSSPQLKERQQKALMDIIIQKWIWHWQIGS
jgi:hypothetical protein